jgi:hypothetical protein
LINKVGISNNKQAQNQNLSTPKSKAATDPSEVVEASFPGRRRAALRDLAEHGAPCREGVVVDRRAVAQLVAAEHEPGVADTHRPQAGPAQAPAPAHAAPRSPRPQQRGWCGAAPSTTAAPQASARLPPQLGSPASSLGKKKRRRKKKRKKKKKG